MTARQAIKTGEQLRQALQVLFMNYVRESERDAVKVTVASGMEGRKRCLWFEIHVPDVYWWDAKDLTHELEKAMPNTRVTEIQVAFLSRSICCVCKELGKTGTYEVNFVQVTS